MPCGKKIKLSNYIDDDNEQNKEKKIIKARTGFNRRCNYLSYAPLLLNETYVENLDFNRYSPNNFRYYDITKYSSYEEQLNSNTPEGNCLKQELLTGNIKFFNLETIVFLLLPLKSAGETLTEIREKNIFRNRFFSFCLNLEKTYLYYKEGKRFCSNQIVPWLAYFNIQLVTNFVFFASNYPMSEQKQTAYYEVSMNKSSFLNQDPIKQVSKCEDFTKNLFEVDEKLNFYQIFKIAFSLINSMVIYSDQVIKAKVTGIPCGFQNELFPLEWAYSYYNEYYNVVLTRNKLLGFPSYFSNGSYNFVDPRKIN